MKNLIKKLSSITFDSENEVESEKLRKFLHVFTEMGSTIGAILIITVLRIVSGTDVLVAFVPIYLFQLVMVEALKIAFKKPRPAAHAHVNLFGKRLTSGSFPSGHTSNIFSLAYLISIYYQLDLWLIMIVFAFAGIIAFSRILLGRHYVIDVVAGALCGLIFSVIGALLLPVLVAAIV